MSTSTLEAINALQALTTLVLRSSEAAQRVSAMIQQAQTEDRDLNDDEIAEIRALRKDAEQRWHDQVGGSG